MGFYNFTAEAIKGVHQPDAGERLSRDGRNLASVIARLRKARPETVERIQSYLSVIVPEVTKIDRMVMGPQEMLRFWQEVDGTPTAFYAASMSDGTLRALAALVAVFQQLDSHRSIRLVGIEEPETALHPAAAGVLIDAFREASEQTQVLVTTHSPDLVDLIDLERDTLLVVAAAAGESRIALADEASTEAIRRHLYTPGELLRMDQLQPATADALPEEAPLPAVPGLP